MTHQDVEKLLGQKICIHIQDSKEMFHKYVGIVSFNSIKDELGNEVKLLKLVQVVKDNVKLIKDIDFTFKQMSQLKKWRVIE